MLHEQLYTTAVYLARCVLALLIFHTYRQHIGRGREGGQRRARVYQSQSHKLWRNLSFYFVSAIAFKASLTRCSSRTPNEAIHRPPWLVYCIEGP